MYTVISNRAIILKIKKQIFLITLLLFSIMFSAHNYLNYFGPSFGQGQGITNSPHTISTSSFQFKVNIIDNMPSQKITIGDIEMAYKQLGESGAKPIVFNHRTWCYDGCVESTSFRATNIIKLFCYYL